MKKNAKKKKNIDYQARRERIENAKTIGLSLFSNQRAIDAGTHNPWWAALIVFILGAFIPLIPMLSQGFMSSGSDMIANVNYGFDTDGAKLVKELNDKDINLVVDESHYLRDEGEKFKAAMGGEYNKVEKFLGFENDLTHEYDLIAYYSNYSGNDLKDFADSIVARTFIQGTTTKYEKPAEPKEGEEKPAEVKTYLPTIIVMSPQNFNIYFVDTENKFKAGIVDGDYLNCDVGFNLKNLALVNNEVGDINDVAYTSAVLDNWRVFFNNTYLHKRNATTGMQVGVAASIFVGLGFFMGLMIFLLTRGKRNINRRLTFLQCQKIQSWAMLTPGILGMIMGFIMPNGAIMFFIIFLGIRIMWMSMKQLRPVIR